MGGGGRAPAPRPPPPPPGSTADRAGSLPPPTSPSPVSATSSLLPPHGRKRQLQDGARRPDAPSQGRAGGLGFFSSCRLQTERVGGASGRRVSHDDVTPRRPGGAASGHVTHVCGCWREDGGAGRRGGVRKKVLPRSASPRLRPISCDPELIREVLPSANHRAPFDLRLVRLQESNNQSGRQIQIQLSLPLRLVSGSP